MVQFIDYVLAERKAFFMLHCLISSRLLHQKSYNRSLYWGDRIIELQYSCGQEHSDENGRVNFCLIVYFTWLRKVQNDFMWVSYSNVFLRRFEC